jgi:hypothetical protein
MQSYDISLFKQGQNTTTKSTKEDTKITGRFVVFVSSFVLFVVNYVFS